MTTAFILLMFRLPARLFAFSFNVFQVSRRSKLRIEVCENHYSLSDASTGLAGWATSRRRQTISSFLLGTENRISDLRRVYFLDSINFEPGDRIIDCGANVGEFYLAIKEIQPEISYFAFEPSREEYELLKKNIQGCELHNLALWNYNGQVTFYLSPEGADSSVILPNSFEKVVQVESAMLESWLSKEVRLLKLEAEGAELEVLEGCGTRLSNIEWISADLGPERGVDQRHTLPEVSNFLLGRGFSIREFSSDRVTVLFHNDFFDESHPSFMI